MKELVVSIVLALCLFGSFPSVAYAVQEDPLQQEGVLSEETPEGTVSDTDEGIAPETQPQQEDILPEATPEELATYDSSSSLAYPTTIATTRGNVVPTPAEAYEAMIALQAQDMYKEGTTWTDDEPYSESKGYYKWKGGPLDGHNISATGCVAFAFSLSDVAFGSLPARMYTSGGFTYEEIKVGDILRVNNATHTVIVLEVNDAAVVVAEGNIADGDHVGKVHWGRGISKEEVMRITSHYITRYPEDYIPPDDPEANIPIANGNLDGGLAWNLTKAGTLTVSGKGAMPDFESEGKQPWKDNQGQIRKVIIEDGVTNIGSCAFWNCGVISAEISSSVTSIGNSAFRVSDIVSVTIPSSVKTVGNNAFEGCKNLSTVTVCEGVETICENAFRACQKLSSITLPSSIGEVGSAAFFECTEVINVKFVPGSKQVKMGDNIFSRCYKLMGVKLPVNIDRIGEGMFQNCGMLAGVEIPQGAESIEASAFSSCSGLTTVIIPDSVATIGIAAFGACPLKDIYFTGTEEQWNSIRKIGDTTSMEKATMHYNYVPAPDPNPDDGDDNNNPGGDNDNNNPGGDNDNNNPGGDNDNNNPGGDNDNSNPGGDKPGDNPGSGSGDNGSNNTGSGSDKTESTSGTSSNRNSDMKAAVETWKPTTPDEKKRYACVGKEAVQYTPSKDNAYQIDIKNAIQGPMCFKSFETVLGDYTIGRTYNIYAPSDTMYSMDKEIQFTIKIPSAIYKEKRDYKMICVTKDGKPIVYNDLDSNPETITIKTDKFYAYALIYK